MDTTQAPEQGMSVREAARQLGVSQLTVRRYIKAGKIDASVRLGKFGQEYRITGIPQDIRDRTAPVSVGEFSHTSLLSRVEQLSQEVGYWRGRCEELEKRVLLLGEGTKKKKPWWARLFSRLS